MKNLITLSLVLLISLTSFSQGKTLEQREKEYLLAMDSLFHLESDSASAAQEMKATDTLYKKTKRAVYKTIRDGSDLKRKACHNKMKKIRDKLNIKGQQ